jgi:hypothetical protein
VCLRRYVQLSIYACGEQGSGVSDSRSLVPAQSGAYLKIRAPNSMWNGRHMNQKRPGDKVIVSVDWNSATLSIVKKDSTAAIKPEGLLCSKYIKVSFGSNDAEKLKYGDTLARELPLDIADLQ